MKIDILIIFFFIYLEQLRQILFYLKFLRILEKFSFLEKTFFFMKSIVNSIEIELASLFTRRLSQNLLVLF